MLKRERISCQKMPLAIYREVAAHLQQVSGISVTLVSQSARDFDYGQSQIEGLCIDYPDDFDLDSPLETLGDRQQQIEAILAYYAKHHGTWERIQCDSDAR
ncbi:MAG: hypothetical protein AB4290_22725 [Spirulina sp.]